MSNSKELMNASYKVVPFFTIEEALKLLKESIKKNKTRSSERFKDRLCKSSLESLSPIAAYVPVYQVNTSGSYKWTETSYENVGNALVGNVFATHERTKSTKKDSEFVISDETSQCIFINASSCLSDERKIFAPIENSEAMDALKEAMTAEKIEKKEFTIDGEVMNCKGYHVTVTKDGYTLSFGMAGQLKQDDQVQRASAEKEADDFGLSRAQTTDAKVQSVNVAEAKAAADYPERFDSMYEVVEKLDDEKVEEEFRQLLELFMKATGRKGKGHK